MIRSTLIVGIVLLLFSLMVILLGGFPLVLFLPSSIINYLSRNSYIEILIAVSIYFIIFAFADKYIKRPWSSFIPKGKSGLLLAVISCLLLCSLLLYQSYDLIGGLGLAADDAWIHQVFARNIARGYDLSFNPGELSTGSSSPLWTYSLSLGYIIGIDPVVFSLVFSGLLMILCLCFFYKLAQLLLNDRNIAILAVLLLAIQFMFVWDVLSGMEIILFTVLMLGALWLARYDDSRWWICVVFLGLAQLTRVEGIFVIFAILGWKTLSDWRRNIYRVLGGSVLIALIVLPMALKYLSISGTILPQTFFAKTGQTSWFFIKRAFIASVRFLTFPSILPLLLVLPIIIYHYIRKRLNLKYFMPLIAIITCTWLAYIMILRYEVAYFRYIHHLIPLIILLVLYGIIEISRRVKRFIIGFLMVTIITGSVMSSHLYSHNTQDVYAAVKMAEWTNKEIQSTSKIAANDVGALGYFSGHYIVDLMGLINSPGLTHKYNTVDDLIEADINYLVIFPEWYPKLVNDSRVNEIHRVALTGKNASKNDLAYVLYHIEY